LDDKISDKDRIAWKKFIDGNEKLPNKDFALKKKISKIRQIDLHGYTLKKANKTVQEYIEKAFESGVSKIIVVTGKGLHSDVEKNPYVSKDLSILKYSVPEFIENNTELMKKIIEIKDANNEDGGSGAFYIFLKKKL
jgi:DNA-nicking Smr family endonuclease